MNYDATSTMNGSVIHIMVVWSKAMKHKDFIVNDLKENFEVLKVFKGHWDKNLYLDNYSVFYAHSQYERDRFSFKSILKTKIEVCGDGDFEVIIFRDNQPAFEKRLTSSGVRIVNRRVFDKKTQYRELTRGGHRVHGSDDSWETNKDLTIMFGMNTMDFCDHYGITDSIETSKHDLKEDTLNHNCIGVKGYDSIQQFFYVLNNTINYVVLRNHEPIPNEYTVEGHGDIDLLVEDKRYAAYLTGAKPVFRQEYRTYHIITIAGKEVPFDFRQLGDGYYDSAWQRDILDTKQKLKEVFYAPNNTHQYYSLLYHAYIQKPEVKEDYHSKLKMYGELIGVKYEPNITTSISQLDEFMMLNGYEYIKPTDKSVYYNTGNLQQSKIALVNGSCIKRLNSLCTDKEVFNSVVFEKPKSFVKKGTNWLIENEANYLSRIGSNDQTPKLLNKYSFSYSKDIFIEISRVSGFGLDVLIKQNKIYSARNIRNLINGVLNVLLLLNQNKIAHRDFKPQNLLFNLKSGKVGVIDFGWATNVQDIEQNRPEGLGNPYALTTTDTDAIMFARTLKKHFRGISYCCRIADVLEQATIDNCLDQDKFQQLIFEAETFTKHSFSLFDLLLILSYRLGIIDIVKDLKRDKRAAMSRYTTFIFDLPIRIYEYIKSKM